MMPNENFCIQPWIHLATWNDGSVPLCCVASPEKNLNLNNQTPVTVWNSEQFRAARLKFIAGEKIPQCNNCWKEEKSGIKSHRIIENEMWLRKLGQNYIDELIKSTDEQGYLNSKPITLDLRLGNTCNLQCVMCRPRDSSKWLQDSKKLSTILISPGAKGDWDHKANSISNTDCFDWFEKLINNNSVDFFLENIRHIIFGGGEPLLLKEHEKFITKLVETGYSKQIELRYHTNGTILNEKLLTLWSNFKEVELMISIDDWGIRNDYIRYPSNWNTIFENLKRLDNSSENIVVNILSTIHAMNIYNFPEFAKKLLEQNYKKICKKNDYLMSVGTTHWPQYMCTRILPSSVKEKIIGNWERNNDLLQNPRWKNRIVSQIDFMMGGAESYRFNDFMDYIDKLDSIRPIKFTDLYSDYWEILRGSNETK